MPDRLTRYAPLTGVAAAVFLVVGFFSGTEPADSSSSLFKVVHYYAIHRSSIESSSVLIGIALLLLALFAASLRAYLRRTPGGEALGALALAGATVSVAMGLLAVAIEYTLAHNLPNLTGSSVQAANIVAQEVFLPILGGVFLVTLASFLAILRGADLPRWLGWFALVVAVLAVIPPVSFVGFLAFIVWIVLTSVFMFIRTDAAEGDGAVAPAGSAPAG